MSSLDIYDDTENIISSDEYSEEDDDDLMNAAISSQHNGKPRNAERSYNRPPSRKSNKRERRLPFRRKLCSKYKTRSLKWLHGKAKREKSKEYLLCLRKKEAPVQESHRREKEVKIANTCKEDKLSKNLSETIDLDESDVEYSSPIKSKEENREIYEEDIEDTANDVKVEMLAEVVVKPEQVVGKPKEVVGQPKEVVEKTKEVLEKPAEVVKGRIELLEKQIEEFKKPDLEEIKTESINKKSQKRARSPTPDLETNFNENKKHQPERPTSSQLYRQINEMFPKHDEVIGNHVKHNSTTLDAVDENMERLMLDIQTLNEILQAKETEWNRLLNLKRVKEEMLGRLSRAKQIIGIKERKFDEYKYSLQALKELETYLSESQSPSTTSVNIGLSTTHQLIESRASMKTEELQKERNNTNRLQNILISSNILQRAEASNYEMDDVKSDSPPLHHTAFNDDSPELQKYQYLEQKIKSRVGRQGQFIDVKSMVADFRQQNPVVFPRVGKRIKASDAGYSVRALSTPPNCVDANSMFMETSYNGNGSNYTPTLEKLLSKSSRNNSSLHVKPSAPITQGFKFNTDSQKSYYRLQSDGGCNEISITPVNCVNRYPQRIQNTKAGLLRTALDVNSPSNTYYDMSDYVKSTPHKSMRDVHNNDHHLQLCQECKMHEARFVCAGCGNQWYCSRECQVNAWDNHSEVCSE
ncbi:PREDICTED: uncharacterized protein LOC108370879 [Rhagoletis zephyria]|uniref:uncharacterized protein LOC108370879 n=2 Tax=Rhagoletis TaxID=28609 RepID=UPI0008113ECE|nr:PREDICTED: uncharacterized protein LOC108370879 [Rhagoletis zephyria]